MPRSPLKIAITTGDKDGIGLEIAQKALLKVGRQRQVHFILWRSSQSYPKTLAALKSKFKLVSFNDVKKALAYFLSDAMKDSELVEIVSSESPALWVQQTAQWCADKKIHGMVTGPISKTEIFKAGLKDMGHTDILKRISGVSKVHMGFIGQAFNVVLTTAHIPIDKVSENLSAASILDGLKAADGLRRKLPPTQAKKPIALLGLNPHAGEMGLIGQEESSYFSAVLKEARRLQIPVWGPLVPDAAFQKDNWKKSSVYLAMYHDQGLIPFKMIHGQDSGVHISLGLPFVRTSVDHGTAKDIFGKGKANPSSMVDAIQACIKLIKSSIK